MSFTLGGPGDILPPRPSQPSSRQIADQQSGGFQDPRKQPVRQPQSAVQQSVPRDVASRTTPDVAAGKQPVTIPQSRGATVTRIADRKPANKSEAIQSAIAQATGNVIPLPNIKAVTDSVRAGAMLPGGSWAQPVTNGSGLSRGGGFVDPTKTATAADISRGNRSTGTVGSELSQAAQRKGITKDALCNAVGIVEAQRHGNSITISLNNGLMKELSGEALKTAARESSDLIKAAVRAGDVTERDVADCQSEYCKRARCGTDHSTGTAEKPAADAPVVTPPPATPPASDTATGTATTGSTGTATSTDTTTIPDSMLPPALPPVTNGGGGGGGAAPPTLVLLQPPALPDEPVRVLPIVKGDAEAKTGMSTATKGFLWVAAGVATYLLFKKLSGVKVVGAAMAGVPLIADLGDLDGEEEDGDEDEGHDDAHETDSEENEE
jgi:hypothetical protein